MLITKFEEKHYPELVEMWKGFDWIAPPIDLLPKNGFVAISEDKVIAASFVYLSCSKIFLLDWVISNKEAGSLTRSKAVIRVIEACCNFAKDNGCKVVYTVTANKSLINTYKQFGFVEMEKDATTLALNVSADDLDFIKG